MRLTARLRSLLATAACSGGGSLAAPPPPAAAPSAPTADSAARLGHGQAVGRRHLHGGRARHHAAAGQPDAAHRWACGGRRHVPVTVTPPGTRIFAVFTVTDRQPTATRPRPWSRRRSGCATTLNHTVPGRRRRRHAAPADRAASCRPASAITGTLGFPLPGKQAGRAARLPVRRPLPAAASRRDRPLQHRHPDVARRVPPQATAGAHARAGGWRGAAGGRRRGRCSWSSDTTPAACTTTCGWR